ncbi:helix-turn-helix transcriptional regulator [Roseomonas marmotae]|uniref:Helix-turn-helix transcriptional regulator n=2 Tax=Roseomonas marmotae TaxID=2768161 RepID=A0ABS3KD04_9PROT|nr:helix-turn-helix transcriptional regulator [Roseomonas marmotae]MBO1075358.1 helix-turn-helix transcriptional regulator [Roseomonas marmotae]
MTEAYERYFYQHDVFRLPFRSLRAGELMLSQDYVSEQEIQCSEYYNDFLRPKVGQAFYNAGAYWELPRQRLLFIGIQRTRRAGSLPRHSANLLRQAWPHLPRALLLAERIGTEREAQDLGFDALDLLPNGVLVLEADCRVVFANRSAEQLMRSAGMTLRPGAALHLPVGQEDGKLTQLVWQATRQEGGVPPLPGSMQCTRTAGSSPPLTLLVAPFQPRRHQRHEGSRPRALVLMSEPPLEPGDISGQIVQLFGLSPSEAGVAAAMASGLSPEEIAQQRAVRVNTIRTQIKSIMSKTGTRRQGELLRLLLSLPRLTS